MFIVVSNQTSKTAYVARKINHSLLDQGNQRKLEKLARGDAHSTDILTYAEESEIQSLRTQGWLLVDRDGNIME